MTTRSKSTRAKARNTGNSQAGAHWLDRHREKIAFAAYYKAQRRGFAPGGEVQDWLEAESEVAARERGRRAPGSATDRSGR